MTSHFGRGNTTTNTNSSTLHASDNTNVSPYHRHHQRRLQSAVGERISTTAASSSSAATTMSSLINTPANSSLYTSQQQQGFHPDDSLEYFIKFPTPNFRVDSAESDYVFVYNETNVPIVMLLGWAGCQDRYLMKYSKIYEDRGLITVRYTAPVDNLFWKRSAMKPIGEKILKLIYDMNFDSHPLIFHVFSNGGAYLYQHISLAIRKTKKPIQIRGMIFDSAPGERRFLGLYRAVTAIYSRERKKCNCITALFITFTLTLMWFVEETYYAFKNLFITCEPPQVNPFHDLKNELSDWPQLFMYSKGDTIIPYKDIEKFAHVREQRGVDVTKTCFEDAEHVKIYIKYPQQYIHCVCKFINKCLSYRGKYE